MTIPSTFRIPALALRRLTRSHVALFAVFIGLCQSCFAQQPATRAQLEALVSEMNAAAAQVQKIVNQPVTRLVRTPEMRVGTYGPGWFHEGATKPDYNNVDVRATRQTTYAQNQYVTSNLNPGFVFLGAELEFNSMTKFFFTDLTVPKKKLSEAEMLEINRLYRIIGRCEQKLAELQK